MESLNAGQVKEALAVHSHIKYPTLDDCSACAYIWSESCREALATDVLALINSQEQMIKELAEENERLKAQRYMVHPDGRLEMIPTVESVRADTVRKMQSEIERRCIKGGIYPAFVARTIDKIAKELLVGE